jgi:flagellar motility protein MotE (MotC chaperone)
MEENMRLQYVLIPAALVSFVAASAFSEETERYRLEKSATGYIRMDTQTGAMSICEERSDQLVCKMAADERAAFQDEVDRLQSSVKALDERVARLESSPTARLESTLPTEEEFNKTMSYMERFLRGFMNIVKDMDKDNGGDGAKPIPQKT